MARAVSKRVSKSGASKAWTRSWMRSAVRRKTLARAMASGPPSEVDASGAVIDAVAVLGIAEVFEFARDDSFEPEGGHRDQAEGGVLVAVVVLGHVEVIWGSCGGHIASIVRAFGVGIIPA
jgi:hypothetical protein